MSVAPSMVVPYAVVRADLRAIVVAAAIPRTTLRERIASQGDTQSGQQSA